MAKKKAATTMADTIETVKPYLERALRDEEFRTDLKDALAAARELYGPLSKQNGVSGGARALATDKKAQEQMRRAFEDLLSAKDTLQGKKKKSHKGRNMVLLAGLIAGALYNPWTGPQTREKLLDLIAGQDDLQPLDTFETVAADATAKAEDAAEAADPEAESLLGAIGAGPSAVGGGRPHDVVATEMRTARAETPARCSTGQRMQRIWDFRHGDPREDVEPEVHGCIPQCNLPTEFNACGC